MLQVIVSLLVMCRFFFFNDTATTEIYTLSLHDALPIYRRRVAAVDQRDLQRVRPGVHADVVASRRRRPRWTDDRSEEHTSELQSRQYLVCRLLLEKKNKESSRSQSPPPPLTPTGLSNRA